MKTAAPDVDLLLRDLALTESEIAERRAFLELGDDEASLLIELHGQLERSGIRDAFVERFYSHLQNFTGTRAFLRDAATVERLKRTQSRYFETLTAGQYEMDYVRHRVRVGLAHERIGLAPKWYLGAYSKYLNLLIPEISALLHADPERARRMVQALLKVILFDMGLAIDTYIHASEKALQQKTAQLDALNQLAITLTSAHELAVILDHVMVEGVKLIGAQAACIAFYDASKHRFTDWATHGLSTEFVRNMQFRPGGLEDDAFDAEFCILSNDRDGSRYPLSKLARSEGIRAYICLPLRSRTTQHGVINVYRKDRDSFEPDEIELLVTFSHLAASAIDNARLHTRLENEASTDVLTGLYNRRWFDQRLGEEIQRSRRFEKPMSLLMLDVDRFKRINDLYGHAAGDAVLRRLAELVTNQLREVDRVARYGGEELVVIFPETDRVGAKHGAERIRRACASTSFDLPDGLQIGVTVSIGFACFPQSADSAASLMTCADHALYAAKQSGRNKVVEYEESLENSRGSGR